MTITKEQAFDLYMAGFYASGEGFNGEYTRRNSRPPAEILRGDFEGEWAKLVTGEDAK